MSHFSKRRRKMVELRIFLENNIIENDCHKNLLKFRHCSTVKYNIIPIIGKWNDIDRLF